MTGNKHDLQSFGELNTEARSINDGLRRVKNFASSDKSVRPIIVVPAISRHFMLNMTITCLGIAWDPAKGKEARPSNVVDDSVGRCRTELTSTGHGLAGKQTAWLSMKNSTPSVKPNSFGSEHDSDQLTLVNNLDWTTKRGDCHKESPPP